ncbi:MAG: ADP-ribosylation factor-like protein [Promethearchaeota archaeon]
MSFITQQNISDEDKRSENENNEIFNQLRKKMVLIGPPSAGKTTIKKCFFELANPLTLLNTSIEPTRGKEVDLFRIDNTYNLLNAELGVFDLAGQENSNWFGSDSNTFTKTDIIMLVFDINTKSGIIVRFLDKIIKVRNRKCKHATLYILLHKIDLAPKSLVYKKVTLISQYLNLKFHNESNFRILQTSITKKFFFSSYQKIESIILHAMKKKVFLTSLKNYEDLSLFLKILLSAEYGVKYDIFDIMTKYKIPKSEIADKIKYLQYLDLIDVDMDEIKISFKLTERADFIAINIKKLQNKVLNPLRTLGYGALKEKKSAAKLDIDKLVKTFNEKERKDLIVLPENSPESLLHLMINTKKKDINSV